MRNNKLFKLISITTATLGVSFAASIPLFSRNITKENINIAQQIDEKLKEFSIKYYIHQSEDASSISKKAIEEVTSFASKLYKENKILSYTTSDNGVVITNKNGVISAFSPSIENTYGDLINVYNNMEYVAYQPIYSEVLDFAKTYDGPISLPEGIASDEQIIPSVGYEFENNFTHITFDHNDRCFQDVNISKAILSKMGVNQIIVMFGHGTYVDGYHSTIETGRVFSWQRYYDDPDYKKDVDDHLILSVVGNEVITYQYIEKYVGKLTNSFVFLGQCQSGMDPVLANTFLAKGASAVIANTDTMDMRYGNVMQYEVLTQLQQNNGSTNKLNTLEESLELAKAKYGRYSPGSGAESLIFGDKDFRINESKICPVVNSTVAYTGKEIPITYKGVGFTYNEEENKGINVGNYSMDITLSDGYQWVNPDWESKVECGFMQIKPAEITPDMRKDPTLKDKVSTNGKPVEIINPGVCEFGTYMYTISGIEGFSDKVPTVTKGGDYVLQWYLKGDDNHEWIADETHPITLNIHVIQDEPVNNVPIWLLVTLIVVGVAGIITLTVLTGNKVKRMSKERLEKENEEDAD